MTARRLLPHRLAVWLGSASWLGAMVLAGCPPRETIIEISRGGAATLINACGNPPLDVSTLCDGLTEACDQADPAFDTQCRSAEKECRKLEQDQLAATCMVPGLPRPPTAFSATTMATRIALVTVGNGTPTVREVSACAPVSFDCPDGLDEACGARGLNAAIAKAIPDGLGFDGLEEAEDTTPVLLVYFDQVDGAVNCAADQLFACGALDQRVPGDDNYDLVCASCQSGPAAAVASAPCFTKCFLQICANVSKSIDAMGTGT